MVKLVFVWTFDAVMKVGSVMLILLVLLIAVIRHLIKTAFRKNCGKCKHCKLYSVSSCGGSNTYCCDIDGRVMYDTYDYFVKCENYEEE